MNTNCSIKLKNIFAEYLKRLDKKARQQRGMSKNGKKKYPLFWPATSVGCEYNDIRRCESSASTVGRIFQSPLDTELLKLGPIGVKIGDNINGACAEDHVANAVLKVYYERFGSKLSLSKLCFTKSVRARTRKVIKPCANCKKVFK